MSTEIAGSLRLDPIRGYDLIASIYDHWKWQRFWDQYEVPLVRRELEMAPGNSAVLDLGTGTGRYAYIAASIGHTVIGVDISSGMLREARAHLPPSVTLVQGSIETIPQRSGSFDVAICARVLSHLKDPLPALREIRRVVAPSGFAVLTDIDAAHGYECTSIPTNRGKVRIETYKRSFEEIERAALVAGLQCRHARWVTGGLAVPQRDSGEATSTAPAPCGPRIAWVASFSPIDAPQTTTGDTRR
jgi:ubiquinone/menaquinone biosynthesis C-methylase UbiE